MDIRNERDILQQFVKLAPYIPLFIDEPVSVAITNRETFIFNQPCEEVPVECELGREFLPGSTPLMVIHSGERIVREVGEHVYGVPFISYAIPLMQDGEVAGCLMIAKSIEVVKNVQQTISDLCEEIEQVSITVSEITQDVQSSAVNNQVIMQLMNHLLKETEQINYILSVINKLSVSSKILGLNAAIEAARAGEAGKGFSVVAKEIENMSTNTTQASKRIGGILGSVDEQLGDIGNKLKETTDAFSNQAAALEEMAATIQNLNANVKIIENYVQQL